MFGNHVLLLRWCATIKLNFRSYIRRNTPNENFEYSYSLNDSSIIKFDFKNHHFANLVLAQEFFETVNFEETISPMGNDRSPGSKHNVWRHHNLGYSKAGNSELETVIRNKSKHSRYCASSGYLQVLKRSE